MDYTTSVKQNIDKINKDYINKAVQIIQKINKKNKIILVGNGASASISSHLAIDFTKAAGVRAINFNEAALLTCFSNDYKYENWVVNALRFYHIPGDLVVLISSSGQSANIINAAKYIKKNNIPLITLSGISKKNPLKNYGKINFYVDSKKYNVIELVHLTILLAIIESLIEHKKLS